LEAKGRSMGKALADDEENVEAGENATGQEDTETKQAIEVNKSVTEIRRMTDMRY